jgi:hypothetical protein
MGIPGVAAIAAMPNAHLTFNGTLLKKKVYLPR